VNLYLEDVLAAQDRLAAAEFGFLQAQTTYNLSLMNLKRAMGTLLQDERIETNVACLDCLPTTMIEKQPAHAEWLPTPIPDDANHEHPTPPEPTVGPW
jgi:hypothetical protein